MKNKELCKKCKWRGSFGAKNDVNICCDYAALASNGTCLKKFHAEVIDRRGDSYDECLLFEEGTALERQGSKEFQGAIERRIS